MEFASAGSNNSDMVLHSSIGTDKTPDMIHCASSFVFHIDCQRFSFTSSFVFTS